MATKASINGSVILRRFCSAAAENVTGNTVIKKAAEHVSNNSRTRPLPVKKDVTWMRDPKTGNWMPESHFEEVDPADLRAELLSKKD